MVTITKKARPPVGAYAPDFNHGALGPHGGYFVRGTIHCLMYSDRLSPVKGRDLFSESAGWRNSAANEKRFAIFAMRVVAFECDDLILPV